MSPETARLICDLFVVFATVFVAWYVIATAGKGRKK
jgi:hypothetical protein